MFRSLILFSKKLDIKKERAGINSRVRSYFFIWPCGLRTVLLRSIDGLSVLHCTSKHGRNNNRQQKKAFSITSTKGGLCLALAKLNTVRIIFRTTYDTFKRNTLSRRTYHLKGTYSSFLLTLCCKNITFCRQTLYFYDSNHV